MAERLSEVEARIGSVRQLSAVIAAMRGIAAVRSREASARLPGILAYADTIGVAIAQALSLHAERPTVAVSLAPDRHIVIAVCSEQGFVDGFNARVLDATAAATRAGSDRTDLMILGSRGVAAAEERGMPVAWSAPMAAHSDQLASLANRLADALFARMAGGAISHVKIVHAQPPGAGEMPAPMIEQALFPFDFARFPQVSRARPPIIQLPAPRLLTKLAEEYVFAQLCEALTLSYAAENEARMHAMVSARENVRQRLDDLTVTFRRLRQEKITEEVIELAAGDRS